MIGGSWAGASFSREGMPDALSISWARERVGEASGESTSDMLYQLIATATLEYKVTDALFSILTRKHNATGFACDSFVKHVPMCKEREVWIRREREKRVRVRGAKNNRRWKKKAVRTNSVVSKCVCYIERALEGRELRENYKKLISSRGYMKEKIRKNRGGVGKIKGRPGELREGLRKGWENLERESNKLQWRKN